MLIKSSEDGKPNSPFKPLNIIAALLILGGVIFLVKPDSGPEPVAADSPSFKLAGETYEIDDLPHRYRQQYYEIERQTFMRQQQILATAASELYVEKQMRETGESKADVVKRLFNPTPPTEAQVKAFYEQNRQRIQIPLAQAKNQIALMLMAQAQQQKQLELLTKLKDLGEFESYLQPPEAPIVPIDVEGYPSKGPADAAVTLIEFGDYQCSHCRSAWQKLHADYPDYENRVRFVFIDFPINQSGISRKVAEGAQCAKQQGKFWEYHDLAYQGQSSLNEASPQQFAAKLSLDIDQFSQCLVAPATAEKVKAAEQLALKSGVTATPTFFLNGIKLTDLDRQRSFQQLLDGALEATNP